MTLKIKDEHFKFFTGFEFSYLHQMLFSESFAETRFFLYFLQ